MWVPLGVKYGIPMEIFWKLNPTKMQRYQTFFIEQLKQKREELSDFGWTNGIYMGRAISCCFSKGSKYPEEPFEFWSDTESANSKVEQFTDADRFAGFVAAFNRNFNDTENK